MAINLITKLVRHHKKGLQLKEELDALLGLPQPMALPNLRILWSLENGPLNVGEIAVLVESARPQVGKKLETMAQSKPALVKTYPGPHDGRQTFAELTKRGIDLIAKLH